MYIKQISAFLENVPGRLAEVTELLAQNGIDIRALSIADTADYGILRLIVNKPFEAERILKEDGISVSLTSIVAIGVDDRPGGLAGVLRMLDSAGISVEYMYAFIGRSESSAFVILRVSDGDAAVELFDKNGVTLLRPQDVYDM